MKKIYIFTSVAIVLIVFCFLAAFLMQKDQEPESKVYVTLMAHIEEGDIYTSCLPYEDYRDRLLEFSSILHENGYKLNLQASYQYFEGVLNCETGEMQELTDGKNVVQFLVDEYDFEIDPHHEGAWDWKSEYNYADTRYVGELVTDDITDMVGVVWDYEPQFEEFDACQQGDTHTDFTFCPEIISGAVGYNHHLGDFSDDDATSGVWIPAGTGDDFTVHDFEGRMITIGSGPHANRNGRRNDNLFATEADYIKVLLKYIDDGRVENQMLTAAIPIPQSSLFGGATEAAEIIRMLNGIKDEENVVFASYTEIADIWREDYGSEPQIFLFDQIDEQDYTY
ncbi:hypothetical protein HN358_03395 [Candidatus Uhrbacteria bacterium]|jgi:hypothetical protein|nr:hypothetical protein [Candidatus Uhrbacteria bacterium]MBT7717600.1 hypothetical protein [Candidatus Uhrbacteria bacterium]